MKNGEGDYRTRHAACPVLIGQKWVSNKWFHEYGNEFNRKCSLDENADNDQLMQNSNIRVSSDNDIGDFYTVLDKYTS